MESYQASVHNKIGATISRVVSIGAAALDKSLEVMVEFEETL